MAEAEPGWEGREFQDLLEAVVEEESAEKAVSAFKGVTREAQFASYHAGEALKVVAPLHQGRSGMQVLTAFFDEFNPGERKRPFREAAFIAEAHAFAALRALHVAVDLIAPVIYYSLALPQRIPKRSPRENNLYPDKVRTALRDHELHPGVVSALDGLLEDGAYRYLHRLVNTTKHRRRVPASLSIELTWTDSLPLHLKAKQFEAYGERHQATRIDEFLNEGRKSVIRGLIGVGLQINAALRDLQAAGVRYGPPGEA